MVRVEIMSTHGGTCAAKEACRVVVGDVRIKVSAVIPPWCVCGYDIPNQGETRVELIERCPCRLRGLSLCLCAVSLCLLGQAGCVSGFLLWCDL